jgi:poly(3-hydroxybutyrate) depolymerase
MKRYSMLPVSPDVLFRAWILVPMLFLVSGCPVTQPQDTPVRPVKLLVPHVKAEYWCYVPSYYKEDHDWPLVVTLHGTHGWDSSWAQIKEWKHLAEQRGFLVVAPELKSVQGILPVNDALWYRDLEIDERSILAVIDDVSKKYRIDSKAVLLTGFSAGGYPLYYTGLRNPESFNMLIARACNTSIGLFERIELTDEARNLPIRIFWGKDDLSPIRDQSWSAIRYLREHGFNYVDYKKIRGGHLRHPEVAYAYWRKILFE